MTKGFLLSRTYSSRCTKYGGSGKSGYPKTRSKSNYKYFAIVCDICSFSKLLCLSLFKMFSVAKLRIFVLFIAFSKRDGLAVRSSINTSLSWSANVPPRFRSVLRFLTLNNIFLFTTLSKRYSAVFELMMVTGHDFFKNNYHTVELIR